MQPAKESLSCMSVFDVSTHHRVPDLCIMKVCLWFFVGLLKNKTLFCLTTSPRKKSCFFFSLCSLRPVCYFNLFLFSPFCLSSFSPWPDLMQLLLPRSSSSPLFPSAPLTSHLQVPLFLSSFTIVPPAHSLTDQKTEGMASTQTSLTIVCSQYD